MTNVPTELLYTTPISKEETIFDSLVCPPIEAYFNLQDIEYLYNIATSIKYASKIMVKRKAIEQLMRSKGFIKFHSGTNRLVFRHLDDTRFVAKIALDKIGMKDNPDEFENQNYLKPFVAKTFQVSPYGVLAFSERVDPILNLTSFLLVASNIFDIIVFKILGKFIMDDIGSNYFMNWGIRHGMGPVLLDYPYLFHLDSNKLYCNKPVYPNTKFPLCGGEIDYDLGFNNLICTKCGKPYDARSLAKKIENKLVIVKGEMNMSDVKVKITRNGVVDFDSEKQSDYITTPSGKRHKISKKEFVVNIFRNNKLSYTNSKENKVVYQEKSNNTVKESFDYKNKYHKPKFGGYVNNNKSVFQEENKEEPKKLISDEDIAKATSNYVKKEEPVRKYDLTKKEEKEVKETKANDKVIGFMSGIDPNKTYGNVSGINTVKNNKKVENINTMEISEEKEENTVTTEKESDHKQFYEELNAKLLKAIEDIPEPKDAKEENDIYYKLRKIIKEETDDKEFFKETPESYLNEYLGITKKE